MNGKVAIKRIKGTPEGLSTVIIAVTAGAFEEEQVREEKILVSRARRTCARGYDCHTPIPGGHLKAGIYVTNY